MTSLVLPDDYPQVLEAAKTTVRAARARALRLVNNELVELYWSLGKLILDRQAEQGWGSKVIDRLSNDLRAEFPTTTGLSPRNLRYARTFDAAWREPIGQQSVAQLGWGHITVLLDKLSDPADRQWYADEAAKNGWTRDVLTHQIKGQLKRRVGSAPSNFTTALPAADSELAQGLTKDPYVFEFIDAGRTLSERHLEDALIDRLRDTLEELGHGFAYLGRQVRLVVGESEYYLDLLFFHVYQLRHVVLELKRGKFSPADAGQLAFYVNVVDDQLRDPDNHLPTVGILLCEDRDDTTVEYALRTSASPMAVATYSYEDLPEDVRGELPSPESVIGAVRAAVADGHTLSEYLSDET